jgi:hypothetical protein
MDFKRDWWRILLAVFAVWLVFFMDLDGRSFAGHLVRIVNTPETHELGDAIGDKFVSFFGGVRRRFDYVYDGVYHDDYDSYRHTHR